jgi:D-glycero-D-manno-heptose 1,7-bisphosphate phosphatase
VKKAAFLDRDGVINIDTGYVSRIEDVEWTAGALDAIVRLKALDYLVFVVTNQSGIARGYYSEEQFRRFTAAMFASSPVDAVLFCPHYPEFTGVCACRKPEPGMLLHAAKIFSFDLAQSFFVGDQPTDLEAGSRAFVTTWQFKGGRLDQFIEDRLSTFRNTA